MSTYPITIETVKNQQQLLVFLSRLNEDITILKKENDALKRQLLAADKRSLTDAEMQQIQSSLSANGNFPLHLTGLMGLTGEVQQAVVPFTVDPTTTDGTLYEENMLATFGVHIYYNKKGNPRTWALIV